MQPEGPNNSIVAGMRCLTYLGLIACPTFLVLRLYVRGEWFSIYYLLCMLLYVVVAAFVGYQARLMSAEVPMADRDEFTARVTEALLKTQHQPVMQQGNTLMFKGQFPWNVFFDAVAIELREDTARVVGPRASVGTVLKTVAGEGPKVKT